jgi:uncharacterized protein
MGGLPFANSGYTACLACSQHPRRIPLVTAIQETLVNIDYPLGFDGRGRTATTDRDAHIRDMIEQLLFTSPGERVNRPTFGSGVLQLVFAPNNDALATATQVTVQGALQQWLGELILVEAVDVENDDAALRVQVRYVLRRTQERRVAEFVRGGLT